MKRTCLTVFLLLAAFCVSARANDSIEELIARLGSRRFGEREEASEALRMMGLPAKEALEKASQSDDPEIRMRAAGILQDIVSGINPGWPAEIRDKARGFSKLSRAEKDGLMTHLVTEYGTDSLPFLFVQVERGESEDARRAVEKISGMADQKAIWTSVLERYREPSNVYEGQLLVSAAQWSNDPDDIASALAGRHVEEKWKPALLAAAVKTVRAMYDDAEYGKAVDTAQSFAKSAPDDARFLYLHSLALVRLGQSAPAGETARKALNLNPEDESSHYMAGEMLMEMNCYSLSEKEWKKILEIPPKDDVYDLNAYLRLGTVYGETEKYALAAEMLETASQKYKTAREKHGQSMGMIGLENLPGMIERYRKLARERGERGENMDAFVDMITVTIIPVVKDGKGGELEKALETVAVSMTANTEPHGFRLFEKAPAALKYDNEKHELSIMLNGSVCSRTGNCRLEKQESFVALHTLDMSYIFKVNRDTGNAERVISFEKDYMLRILPDPEILAWKDAVIRLNGNEHSWQELAKGVPFDYLPRQFELEIKGVREDGQKLDLKRTIDPAESKNGAKKPGEPTVIKLSIEAIAR